MKQNIKETLFVIFIVLLIGSLYTICWIHYYREPKNQEVKIIIYSIPEEKTDWDYSIPEEKTDWDYFIEALIWKESRGNDTIIGRYDNANSVGCLQITPIYVAEVNRILGEDIYTLDDRLSREKSIEMFNIIQDYYNPTQDLQRAIELHNPNASLDYYGEIVNKYVELKNK